LGRGQLRVVPEDFVVEEDLGFTPDGAGSHALLRVRKRNANTEWVARELARAVGCRPGDVGYAGLKDRHALTTQWFSVPLPRARRATPAAAARDAPSPVSAATVKSAPVAEPNALQEGAPPAAPNAFREGAPPAARDALRDGAPSAAPNVVREDGPPAVPDAIRKNALPAAPAGVDRALADLAAIRGSEFEVLEAHAHAKKLPRGALAGNRFTLRIRGLDVPETQLSERLAAIARSGVPNYFGPQRFGRDGANLRKINANPETINPRERTYVLSAARSLIFNAVLAQRVAEGTWHRLEPGDVANLDARGSVFPVEVVDETLAGRAERLEVHPTGPMWGRDEPMSAGRIRSLEERIASGFAEPCALVIAAGMRQERRSLRLVVRELQWALDGADLLMSFWLTRGSFATTVLRELIEDSASEQDI
jgi:tRNA(Glu) U13 pseudouridine synthase TruD